MSDSDSQSAGSRGGQDSMTEEVSAKCNDCVLEGMLQRQTQLFARQ